MRIAKFTKPLSLALPETLYTKIKEISDREQVSMAETVRQMLSAGLEQSRDNEFDTEA